MMKNPMLSEPSMSARPGRRFLAALLEPPMGIEAKACSVFPGGVAISYAARTARPDAWSESFLENLDRVYYPQETGYVIGYADGRFGRISFSCVRTGDYKSEEPSRDEIKRFRMDLAEAARKDPSVGQFVDAHPQLMG